MKQDFTNSVETTRQLRKTFILAIINEGSSTISKLQADNQEWSTLIENTFPHQAARAAVWFQTERNAEGLTPVQQLSRGQMDDVKERLRTYKRPERQCSL